jgi:hypothetical protein
MHLFFFKKKICFAFVLAFTMISSLAQAQQGERVINTTSIKGGILAMTLSKEYSTGKITTINFELGFLTGSASYSAIDKDWRWGLPLGVMVEPRIYYNFGQRSARNKNVRFNAADFFSLATSYSSGISMGNIGSNPAILIIPHWGIRRMMGNRFYFEPSIGYGIGYVFSPKSTEDWTDTFSLNIKFGFLLNTSPSKAE